MILMNDKHKIGLTPSNADLYATLMLSDKLENEQNNIEDKENEILQPTSSSNSSSSETLLGKSQSIKEQQKELAQHTNVEVIWVPADKHPQIAPTEFAEFIKTHGMNIPTRRSTTLHRRKSILSQTVNTPERRNTIIDNENDEDELHRTLSEKKRLFLKKIMSKNEQVEDLNFPAQTFDRNSASKDDSRIIAPRTNKSLLRRSAFSARGRNRKTFNFEDKQQATQQKSLSQRKPDKAPMQSEITINPSWNTSEGIRLYDQPVNMSEWIDLGSASLESDDSQRGILSRVHDAESQLLLQIDNNSEEEETRKLRNTVVDKKEENPINDIELDNEHENKSGDSAIVKDDSNNNDNISNQEQLEKSNIILPETNTTPTIPDITTSTATRPKPEKRASWLGGLLFNEKKNNKKNGASTTSVALSNNTSNNSPLSGLASIFSRSLSMKSNTHYNKDTKSKLKNKSTIITTNQLPITSTSISTSTTTTTTTTSESRKKPSSRLDTFFSPEHKLFNSNRLPLHVERAIYRLSHIKLTDPRRPLCQQVLISNLMFWYLSIQNTDFQQLAERQTAMNPIPEPDIQQNKKIGKMSRLISSAKKRGNEVAQLVQAYPLTNHQQETVPIRPRLKQNSVQFNLVPIPSHNSVNGNEKEEEEDNIPLSCYKK
ncbi:MAG: hypothetical protein EXX96DRAFT_528493 [Benjaminiella poitrasii]|nr:MAG: hypothetical protein EXX96DRAFT_528493 [Benjaminiella poitrasii]